MELAGSPRLERRLATRDCSVTMASKPVSFSGPEDIILSAMEEVGPALRRESEGAEDMCALHKRLTLVPENKGAW